MTYDELVHFCFFGVSHSGWPKACFFFFRLVFLVSRVRAEEIGVLMKATILRAINEALFFIQPAILSFLVFGTYYLLGNTLTPEKVN